MNTEHQYEFDFKYPLKSNEIEVFINLLYIYSDFNSMKKFINNISGQCDKIILKQLIEKLFKLYCTQTDNLFYLIEIIYNKNKDYTKILNSILLHNIDQNTKFIFEHFYSMYPELNNNCSEDYIDVEDLYKSYLDDGEEILKLKMLQDETLCYNISKILECRHWQYYKNSTENHINFIKVLNIKISLDQFLKERKFNFEEVYEYLDVLYYPVNYNSIAQIYSNHHNTLNKIIPELIKSNFLIKHSNENIYNINLISTQNLILLEKNNISNLNFDQLIGYISDLNYIFTNYTDSYINDTYMNQDIIISKELTDIIRVKFVNSNIIQHRIDDLKKIEYEDKTFIEFLSGILLLNKVI